MTTDDGSSLRRRVALTRIAVGLDDFGRPTERALREMLSACLIVAAEVECLMAGVEPCPANLERVAGQLAGAALLGGMELPTVAAARARGGGADVDA